MTLTATKTNGIKCKSYSSVPKCNGMKNKIMGVVLRAVHKQNNNTYLLHWRTRIPLLYVNTYIVHSKKALPIQNTTTYIAEIATLLFEILWNAFQCWLVLLTLLNFCSFWIFFFFLHYQVVAMVKLTSENAKYMQTNISNF